MLNKIIKEGASALAESASDEKDKISEIFNKIQSHPFKVFASFITAPILIIKIALMVKNPIRRIIAIFGILLSISLSCVAATFFGSLVGAVFIASHIGLIAGASVLLGTTFSLFLRVAFVLVIFNTICFVFLKISSQNIIDHLNEIST